MKRISIVLGLLLNAVSGIAYDTYLFRVAVSPSRTKADVKTLFTGKGQSSNQPFLSTYVLAQPNTDYVLVKITPKDAAELTQTQSLFGLSGTDLYQIYKLNSDTGLELAVDNSKQFPVNSNWADIQVSTPAKK